MPLSCTCISDTHNMHHMLILRPGDALIHAGDFTVTGSLVEIEEFGIWLEQQPFTYKVIVSGNHDRAFERNFAEASAVLRQHCPDVIILNESGVEIEGYKFWGSPWTPRFGRGWAFNHDPEHAPELWSKIPDGLDVLITHGPPFGILDQAPRGPVGCPELASMIAKKAPKWHVFGHIHEGAGSVVGETTTFINAAIVGVGKNYWPANRPTIFWLDEGENEMNVIDNTEDKDNDKE